jgi:hypothetical protein
MANTPSYVRSYEGRSLLEGVIDILTLMDIGHMPKKMQCPTRSEMVPLVGSSKHIQRPRIKRQSKFECFCFECGRYNEERKMMVFIADWFGICKSCIRQESTLYN